MKNILTVIVLSTTLALGGCAGGSIFSGGTSLTASVNNPVTPTMLYETENGLTVAISGMLAYKNLCARGTIPASCRAVVAQLQSYVRTARPILKSLRAFVRNNDQVNAITAYTTVQKLLSDFNATAAQNGV